MSQSPREPRRFWCGGRRNPEQDHAFCAALDAKRWQAGAEDDWQACWFTGNPSPALFQQAGPGRRINHIPGNNCLTVKSLLHATLQRSRERLSAQHGPGHPDVARLDFVPQVFSMPRDYHALQRAALAEPGQRWICKPKNAARGKDIHLLRDVAEAPTGARWMVQRYLDRPHLMHGHKYVLRLYLLIAGLEPLRVYLYRQGFAKLASEPYTEDDLDNPYVHLTNPDVNALNLEAPASVVFVEMERYAAWLREQGHDPDALWAQICDLAALTALSARESMLRRCQAEGVDPAGCYELLGLDCLVDDQLKPWILECNLSPSMEVCAEAEHGGEAEARIKRQLLADTAALLGLNLPGRDGLAEAAVPDGRDGDDARLRRAAEAERARAGDYQCLFPAADAGALLSFLPLPRRADLVLADALHGASVARPRLRRWQVAELIDGDQLSLYEPATGRLGSANETAALIWLQASQGEDPDAIAAALAASAEAPRAAQVASEVWATLVDWVQRGLLIQQRSAQQGGQYGGKDGGQDADAAAAPAVHPAARPAAATRAAPEPPPEPIPVCVGEARLQLLLHGEPLQRRLGPLLAPLTAPSAAAEGREVIVAEATPGYAVTVAGRQIAAELALSEVAGCLRGLCLRAAAEAEGGLAFDASLLALGGDDALLICREPGAEVLQAALLDALGQGGEVLSGGALLQPDDGRVTALGLPLPSQAAGGSRPGWRAASAALAASRRRVAQILLVPAPTAGRQQDETPPSGELRTASQSRLLAAFLAQSRQPDGSPLRAAQCRALAGWLQGLAAHLLPADAESAQAAAVRAVAAARAAAA